MRLHVFLMRPQDDKEVDHVDGDPTNNKRSNLRLCTHSQNIANRGTLRHNTSGVTGVKWESRRSHWVAEIEVNSKKIYLGSSKDKSKAIDLRKDAEELYFGEFVRKE